MITTKRLALFYLSLLVGVATLPARADVYKVVAADGSVTFTNVYRPGRGYVRILRTPKAKVAAPAVARAPRPPAAQPATRAPAGLPYASQVAAAAAAHQLPEALLHAVIRTESNYNPVAISGRGAIGLMQLMPDTARELGVSDPWDPAANIHGGARYLKHLLQMFDNDLQLALAAYNAGPGAVLRQGRAIPPYAETRQYVPRVIERFRHLQNK
ncbi:Transglycosylase SLT domain-containing protein [Geopseudomonas sagittaria]|uniref:Transglycosylase SLT domain-containing protein n=1 Tax=Geopseudomonas sagittaria TaxID=1135990 RepID=A0A1I5Q4G5_9GAMM|nr:lytic transglycosylase domain-containing protein [Pseudomonas sagittaria]SFP40786.1 Transglycosylase SLT domain-containing protein [Pseudomonas sagittaria]